MKDLLFPWGIIGLLIVAADFIYQWTKTRTKDPQWCFWAFRHNRWVGLMIFIAIFMGLMTQ